MTASLQPQPLGSDPPPAPLRVVQSSSELQSKLANARDGYAGAIAERKRIHAALERCKHDADVNMLSRRAAHAYLSGTDPAAADGGDVAKARSAAAALPELRRTLRTALDSEQHARGSLRAALGAIARERFESAAHAYAVAAIQMGQAWRELLASHRTLDAMGGHAPALPAAAVSVCAIALDLTGRDFATVEAWSTKYYVAPDNERHADAAHALSFEQQRDLRALVGSDGGDALPWPYDDASNPERLAYLAKE